MASRRRTRPNGPSPQEAPAPDPPPGLRPPPAPQYRPRPDRPARPDDLAGAANLWVFLRRRGTSEAAWARPVDEAEGRMIRSGLLCHDAPHRAAVVRGGVGTHRVARGRVHRDAVRRSELPRPRQRAALRTLGRSRPSRRHARQPLPELRCLDRRPRGRHGPDHGRPRRAAPGRRTRRAAGLPGRTGHRRHPGHPHHRNRPRQGQGDRDRQRGDGRASGRARSATGRCRRTGEHPNPSDRPDRTDRCRRSRGRTDPCLPGRLRHRGRSVHQPRVHRRRL